MTRTCTRTRRTTARGFTLVELMVSLVAGLLITIAVVGLAKTATTTFYEEARLSTVEGSVRSASERLRQDLARTAYMSTGNLHLAGANAPINASLTVPYGHRISHVSTAATPSRYGAVTDSLQGIRINVGGSKLATDTPNGLASLVTNSLNPDELFLTGNFTTDDAYRGVLDAGNASMTVYVADDPAVARLVAGPVPDRAVRNAFAPGAQPTGAIYPALARIVDIRGCSTFVVLSAVSGNATSATFAFGPSSDGNTPVLVPGVDGGDCGANPQEEVTINPVQILHWYIGPTSVALRPDPAVDDYKNKFDLYREFLDANGAAIPAPGGPQVVAEYAIDLKFGLTVDDASTAVLPPANRKIFDMDADGTNIGLYTAASVSSVSGGPGPQRVRAVRYRISTRAALADRTGPLPATPAPAPYLFRYCLDAACTKAARVRTIMSEVMLTNQARMTY